MKPRLLKIDVEQYEDACIDHGRKAVHGYQKSGGAKRGPGMLHRLVFLEFRGHLPEAVMHTCDNPRCINPKHLVGGTRDQNNKDRAIKGRSAKSVPSRRKLSQEQAEEIRRRWQLRRGCHDGTNGVTRLAADYGVDTNVIYNIVEGRTHVQ